MATGRPISAEDYGKPMKCPKCPTVYGQDPRTKVWVRGYFGWLKLPGLKTPDCPNCGARLVGARRRPRT